MVYKRFEANKDEGKSHCPRQGIHEVLLHPVLTSALDGGEWMNLRPNHFTSEDERWGPLSKRLCGAPLPFWRFAPPSGFETSTLQPVAQSLYGLRYLGSTEVYVQTIRSSDCEIVTANCTAFHTDRLSHAKTVSLRINVINIS
jgi:hypothetical protein